MIGGVDPMFPQMTDALDPAVMGPLLRRTLGIPEPDGAVGSGCMIGEKRYEPGKSLLISYRLDSHTVSEAQPRRATARLCAPGMAEQAFVLERLKRPDCAEGGLRFLREPAMLLWVFPHDRKLVHLPRLLDLDATSDVLAPGLHALGVRPTEDVLRVRHAVLHYLPERSCMIRYRVALKNAGGLGQEAVQLYAKTYADDTGAEVFSIMSQLKRQFPWGAQALSYDAVTHTLWQSHVPGEAPTWMALDSPSGLRLATSMGRCVAALHACSVDTQRRLDPDAVPKALLETVRVAERTDHPLQRRIGEMVGALLAITPRGEPELTPVHCDLKLKNFLAVGDTLRLIDMDGLTLGDPVADIASLIANLYLHGLRKAGCSERVHPLASALARAYRENRRGQVSMQCLRWHVAAALVHEVTRRSLRQMDAERMGHIAGFLALSEHFAALCRAMGGDGDELV